MKNKSLLAIIFSAGLLVGGLTNLVPRHRHTWTKWEYRTIEVMHFYTQFGKVSELGRGPAVEGSRICTGCGIRQEKVQ